MEEDAKPALLFAKNRDVFAKRGGCFLEKKAESPLHLADQGIQDLRTHNVKTDDKKGFFGDVFN